MATNQETVFREHPCFGACKNRKGRIHLPVAPGCNIECRFCDRRINEDAQVPGNTSKVIKPEEACGYIRKALEFVPELTTVGIAGPGDTLATPFALDTFRLVKKEFPQLIRCMSTNGLLLNDKADEVIGVGIDSLTVTVNAVDPEIEAMINARIFYHGKTYTGIEAAEILIHNQLEGIRKVAKSGTLIKVNTVLCPGINDKHIEDVAATVREAGAIMYNIIPLIPQNGFKDIPAPTPKTLAIAQEQAGVFINVFKHCAHCRADAVGVPGVYDVGAQIYMDRIRVKETFSHG